MSEVVSFTVRLPVELAVAVDNAAAALNMSRQRYIEYCLRERAGGREEMAPRWTQRRPYSVSIFMPGQAERQLGPFAHRAAASVTAGVIRDAVAGYRPGADLPRITVFDSGVEAVQLQGFDLAHYRPVIADVDVYDASPRRGEWQYILAAIRQAGANGSDARTLEG